MPCHRDDDKVPMSKNPALREGSRQLLEIESDCDDQRRQDDGAFAMKPLCSRFFWLCGECAKTLIVKRWTTSGLVVVLRNQSTVDGHPNLGTRPGTAATTRLGVTDCPTYTPDGD